MSLSSEPETFARPDQIRSVSPQLSEVRFTADQKLLGQLEELKGLLAHRNADMSLGELITQISAIALEKLREQRSGGRARSPKGETTSGAKTHAKPNTITRVPERSKNSTASKNSNVSNASETSLKASQESSQESSIETVMPEGPHLAAPASRSRHIPAPIRRAVFKRDGLACTYHDPISGRRCGSQFALELDHRIPFAKGGLHGAENLTVRCRAHNQWAAQQAFGLKKMAQYARHRGS